MSALEVQEIPHFDPSHEHSDLAEQVVSSVSPLQASFLHLDPVQRQVDYASQVFLTEFVEQESVLQDERVSSQRQLLTDEHVGLSELVEQVSGAVFEVSGY